MAIDTTAKKLAAMNLGATGGGIVLPDVGAAIDLVEKQHIMGLYVDVLGGSSATSIGMGVGGGMLSVSRSHGRK